MDKDVRSMSVSMYECELKILGRHGAVREDRRTKAAASTSRLEEESAEIIILAYWHV